MKKIAEMDGLLNVLCLEDDLKDAELINEMLTDAGYLVSMDIAESEQKYVDFLKGRNYDIILADNSIHSFDALAALKVAHALKPEIPFICVSGTIGEEEAVELLKQGAADYVLKDRLGRLAIAVKSAVEEAEVQKKLKQSEGEIIHQRGMLRTLIDNLPNQIYVKDFECRKVIANKADVSNIGYKKEAEVLGKTDIELFPGKIGERGYADDREVIGSGKAIFDREEDYVDNKGVRRWLLTTKIPLVEKDGKITGLVGIGHDITDRKLVEEELVYAKNKAEESDRLKSAFLTNLGHEIRTPMNGILGFTELLKEPNLTSDEQQDFIQTIQISGARMLNTINNIVDFSKIESGQVKVDIKESNINEQIEFLYAFFKPEVKIKGLQFLFKNSLTTKESIIKTDNEKVYGILTNLVKNAIKFTYEGSIEFGYVLKSDSEPAELEFFVKDTGVGIPDNQKELIFERFRQGSENHTRGYEGSGLGLSICKSYVEMLGGEIWVESEEGKGSKFYFTIPYNAATEEKSAIRKDVSEEDKEVQIKKLKILIVEDDEVSYLLLSNVIQKISKEVLHSVTGVEAVDACRNNPDLDLVLMDIRMPKMDGYEATRQIRQFNKAVIIIAQTAYGFSSDCEKALEAGCSDYISKPINKTLLYELIKKHVK